jgi:hypothetical protein
MRLHSTKNESGNDILLILQLSASGDTGIPEVVADPQGEVAKTFENIGVCVVRQCAKIRQQGKLIPK